MQADKFLPAQYQACEGAWDRLVLAEKTSMLRKFGVPSGPEQFLQLLAAFDSAEEFVAATEVLLASRSCADADGGIIGWELQVRASNFCMVPIRGNVA